MESLILTAEEARKISSPLQSIFRLIKETAENGYHSVNLYKKEPSSIFCGYELSLDKFERLTPWYRTRLFYYTDQDIEELKNLGYIIHESNPIQKYLFEGSSFRCAIAKLKSKETKLFSKELKYPGLTERIQEYIEGPKVHTVSW